LPDPPLEVRRMTSEMPFYLQVADQLELKIAALAAGEPMPSEHELARDHEINRLTARAALEELQRRYLVRRQQGRRTVVARRIEYRLDAKGVPGWTKTVAKTGAVPRTEIDTLRLRQPPADIRATLKLAKKASALYLGRRRFVDDELAAYSASWLNPAFVPHLEERLGAAGTLNAALRRYDLKPRRGLLRCQLGVAPADLAQRFESYDRPLVFDLTTHLLTGKRHFGVTTTWLRADIFNVVFEMRDARD
jgi:GntR family transcriptional regulator